MDKTMKITGKGKVSVKPDIIRLNMTMEESYKEYEVTLRQSSETTKILKELFVSLGFKNDDLKTRSFDINTKYESYKAKDQSWKKRLIGYTYTHHMLIEFDADNKKLGDIVSIDYSWGEISFVSEPIQNFAFASAEKTMGSPGYDIDIEADDIDVTDTVTVIWNIK